jgi:hypothetical protein
VSFIDKNILFNTPLRSDAVDWDYSEKVSFGRQNARDLIREFCGTLKAADLQETDMAAEWRLAFVVRGPWNEKIWSVYADGSGRIIKIGEKKYLMTKEVAAWIDRRLWAVEETVRRATAPVIPNSSNGTR